MRVPLIIKFLNINVNSGNKADASIPEKMTATIKTFSMLQGLSRLPDTFFLTPPCLSPKQ